MNWVTILWSLASGACLTLAMMHALIWLKGKTLLAHLAFSIAALAAAGIGACELMSMSVTEPQRYATILWWAQLPVGIMLIALAFFVRFYFQTGWRTLFWLVIGSRLLVLAINFLQYPGIIFLEITTLKQIPFLGQSVTVINEAIPNPWHFLAKANLLLFLGFFSQATWTLWKKGDSHSKRRAAGIGGSLIIFNILAAGHSTLVNAQLIHSPYLITFAYLSILVAMAYQLSHDLSTTTQLAFDLQESQQQISLAASAAKLALWTWEVMKDEIWVTTEGRRIYGVDPEERITIKRFQETIHPNDRELVQERLNAALQGERQFQADYRIILPNGEVRWIAARGEMDFGEDNRPLRLRGISRDTSIRVQAEERSREVVEAAPYSIIMVDGSGTITLVNRQAEVTFGHLREDLIGLPISALIPERFRGGHDAMHRAFLHHPTTRQMGAGRELSGLRKDGTEFPIEVGLTPVCTSQGRFVLAAVSDISERKFMEKEMRTLREALAHLSRVTSLGLLSGSLAHELNQPLASILSNAEAAQRFLAQEPPDLPEVKEILADIISEDLRASQVIKRLRAMVKPGELELAPVGINTAVVEVGALVKGDLAERSISLALDLDSAAPVILADRVQIQQVLLNLVLNAADAVADEPTGARRIEITTNRQEDRVLTTVRDTGHGLPTDAESLFKPFVTTKGNGLGMGLAICKSIVESHHGLLFAQPHPEKGAIFCFELPAAESAPS
jgi:two-component system, LuxR family, sensor kinase FixL